MAKPEAELTPAELQRSQRFKALLDRGGWKPGDLAKQLGVDRTTVHNWVRRGKIPGSEKLPALARHLSTSREWIVSGQGREFVDYPPEVAEVATVRDEMDRRLAAQVDAINSLRRDVGRNRESVTSLIRLLEAANLSGLSENGLRRISAQASPKPPTDLPEPAEGEGLEPGRS